MTVETVLPEHPLLQIAIRMADAARAETLPRFRTSAASADNKAEGTGGYDPVTEADRAAEAAMRAVLAAERPDDGILGEEEAAVESRSGATWVIDPIDGTRSFVSGMPVWGTLIAHDDGSRGILGIVDQPFTDERYIGLPGLGAWLVHRGGIRAISVRGTASLAEATLMTTTPDMFEGAEARAFADIAAHCRLVRYGADCYAYALLALGQIDLVVEAGLAAYDIAGPKALIEAAGGVVTDWEGGDCRWGGRVVAAATPALHGAALERLAASG